MNKKAFLAGCNYPGTSHALRGCVNDVNLVKNMLETTFGFSDIEIITDEQVTTSNIKTGLNNLVTGAKAGDTLFFHFSGHGSQLPDYSNEALEDDGLDELIVPIDIDWREKVVTDDMLKKIFDKVPQGVHLTICIDACHSGSGLDQQNRYQPLGVGEARNTPMREVPRFLAPPQDVFDDALKKQKERNLRSANKPIQTRDVNRVGLLISGCQSQQTSADAYIGGTYVGACTKYLTDIVSLNSKQTYKRIVDRLNNKLVEEGYSQRPELNGSQSLFLHKFLQSAQDDAGEEVDPTIQDPSNPNPSVVDVNDENPNVNVPPNGNDHTGQEGETGDDTSNDNSEDGGSGSTGGKPDSTKTLLAIVVFLVVLILFFTYNN